MFILQKQKDVGFLQNDNEQNSKKLEQIYNLYAKKLLGFAYTYFRNQFDAEDAVAAVFVKIAGRNGRDAPFSFSEGDD